LVRVAALLALGLALAFSAVPRTLAENENIQTAIRTEVDGKFADARVAYDDNRMDAAIQAYEGILQLGYESDELYFNLANAYFKKGQVGPAVLNYRRAQYTAPRDPDIRANLGYAFESAGIAPPESSLVSRVGGSLSMQEWVALATLGFWGLFLSLASMAWWRRSRIVAHRTGMAFTAVLALSITGISYWVGLRRTPEVVVMRPNQQVLFAPLEGSTVHFAAPEGTMLRVEDEDDGWLKVISGKQSGWIVENVCERI
jgi:hypothetical protein